MRDKIISKVGWNDELSSRVEQTVIDGVRGA